MFRELKDTACKIMVDDKFWSRMSEQMRVEYKTRINIMWHYLGRKSFCCTCIHIKYILCQHRVRLVAKHGIEYNVDFNRDLLLKSLGFIDNMNYEHIDRSSIFKYPKVAFNVASWYKSITDGGDTTKHTINNIYGDDDDDDNFEKMDDMMDKFYHKFNNKTSNSKHSDNIINTNTDNEMDNDNNDNENKMEVDKEIIDLISDEELYTWVYTFFFFYLIFL